MFPLKADESETNSVILTKLSQTFWRMCGQFAIEVANFTFMTLQFLKTKIPQVIRSSIKKCLKSI